MSINITSLVKGTVTLDFEVRENKSLPNISPRYDWVVSQGPEGDIFQESNVYFPTPTEAFDDFKKTFRGEEASA